MLASDRLRVLEKFPNDTFIIREPRTEELEEIAKPYRDVVQALVNLQPIYTYDEFGEQRFACACCRQTAPHGGLSEMEHEERCPLRMARELLRV